MYATEARNPWPIAGTVTAVCLAVLLGGGAYVVASMRPEPVTVPTSFDTFKAADGSFQCLYPSGWHSAGAESHGIESAALFHKGNASIKVESSLTTSLIGDTPPAPSSTPSDATGGGEVPSVPSASIPDLPNLPGMGDLNEKLKGAQRPAIEKVHILNKKPVEASHEGYEEQAAQPFQSAFGDARVSEFTAKAGGFGGKLHGYRASFLSTERGLSATVECSETDWEKLKPAFWKVVTSVSPGVQR